MNAIALCVTLTICNVFGQYHDGESHKLSRLKRGSSGALEIITNHANPIHADVKNEKSGITDKPCPKNNLGNVPSNIESGTVFQVTPPKDTIYKGKSLRKSFPLSTKLDLIREISRGVTVLAILFSAIIEFYPAVQNLYYAFYDYYIY